VYLNRIYYSGDAKLGDKSDKVSIICQYYWFQTLQRQYSWYLIPTANKKRSRCQVDIYSTKYSKWYGF